MSYRQESKPPLVVHFGNRVFGVDPASGEIVWETDSSFSGRIVIEASVIYCAAYMEMICLALATGEIVWRSKINHHVNSFVRQDDCIFAGGVGEVTCLVAETGEQLWHNGFRGKGIASVSLGFPGNVMWVDERR